MISLLPCLASGPVQVAYGVDDLSAAVEQWTDAGVGPFIVREHIAVDDALIFGAAASFDHSSAYAWWGELMVELVQVHAPAALAGTGLHHMAWFVDSFDSAAEQLSGAGLQPAMTARAGQTRFAFFDARDELGHYIEIYEGTPALRGFYASVLSLSADARRSPPVE